MFDYRVIFAARGRAGVLAAAGIAGGLLVTLAGSAEAQFFGWWGSPPAYGVPENAMIRPGEIYRIVADRGYQVTGGLQRNGRVYIVDAIDQWGRACRLVVDAYEGDILQRFATTPPRPPASIPQPQSQANLYPQYSSYPAYPNAAPPPAAAAAPHVIPGIGHKTSDDARRSHVKKTQTAAGETGTPAVEPARPGRSRSTARTEAVPPRPAADVVAPRPAAKVEPATAAAPPQPAAKPEPATAAVTPAPPASSPKPARPNTDGPGYANGVPINPLD
jgi:hypothetical protein